MLIEKKTKSDKDTENEIPACIICVGSTGSGKSATISKYTRLPIQSNAGMARVTTKCSMYKRPNDEYAWIDTGKVLLKLYFDKILLFYPFSDMHC